MNPLGWLKSAFDVIAGIFGFARERAAMNNTPAMQTADKAKKEEEANAKDREAIAKGDLDAIRKSAAP